MSGDVQRDRPAQPLHRHGASRGRGAHRASLAAYGVAALGVVLAAWRSSCAGRKLNKLIVVPAIVVPAHLHRRQLLLALHASGTQLDPHAPLAHRRRSRRRCSATGKIGQFETFATPSHRLLDRVRRRGRVVLARDVVRRAASARTAPSAGTCGARLHERVLLGTEHPKRGRDEASRARALSWRLALVALRRTCVGARRRRSTGSRRRSSRTRGTVRATRSPAGAIVAEDGRRRSRACVADAAGPREIWLRDAASTAAISRSRARSRSTATGGTVARGHGHAAPSSRSRRTTSSLDDLDVRHSGRRHTTEDAGIKAKGARIRVSHVARRGHALRRRARAVPALRARAQPRRRRDDDDRSSAATAIKLWESHDSVGARVRRRARARRRRLVLAPRARSRATSCATAATARTSCTRTTRSCGTAASRTTSSASSSCTARACASSTTCSPARAAPPASGIGFKESDGVERRATTGSSRTRRASTSIDTPRDGRRSRSRFDAERLRAERRRAALHCRRRRACRSRDNDFHQNVDARGGRRRRRRARREVRRQPLDRLRGLRPRRRRRRRRALRGEAALERAHRRAPVASSSSRAPARSRLVDAVARAVPRSRQQDAARRRARRSHGAPRAPAMIDGQPRRRSRSAPSSRSTTCRSTSARASASRSSARTAPARRRCCARILGLVRVEGRVTIGGVDVAKRAGDRAAAASRTSRRSRRPSTRRSPRWCARTPRCAGSTRKQDDGTPARRLGLDARRRATSTRFRDLSGGMKQKLLAAMALATERRRARLRRADGEPRRGRARRVLRASSASARRPHRRPLLAPRSRRSSARRVASSSCATDTSPAMKRP